MALDARKPPTVTQDPPAEKETPKKMEIVLTTLPLLAKANPASKGPEALEAASTQPIHGPPKDKIMIKKKWFLVFRCFFLFFYFFFKFVIRVTSLYLIYLFLRL